MVKRLCKEGNTKKITAINYVRTMLFGAENERAFTAKYKVRAYAKLANGSYEYSDITDFNVYDTAKYLYDNAMMRTYAGHEYIYTNILKVMDPAYKEVDYAWGNTIVRPEWFR